MENRFNGLLSIIENCCCLNSGKWGNCVCILSTETLAFFSPAIVTFVCLAYEKGVDGILSKKSCCNLVVILLQFHSEFSTRLLQN